MQVHHGISPGESYVSIGGVGNVIRLIVLREKMIYTIRDTYVMIDRDLAELYGVETKVLNQAVKRNGERFPESFKFRLTKQETYELVTICDRFLIIDDSVYHIGASVKDLGKKWFAVSLMEAQDAGAIISRLEAEATSFK